MALSGHALALLRCLLLTKSGQVLITLQCRFLTRSGPLPPMRPCYFIDVEPDTVLVAKPI
jgi:hypothetical protein